MLQELVNHNEDLRKLLNEGYELEIIGGYLVIHHIPYIANINGELNVKDDGKLVTQLNLSGTSLNKPFDHTAYFTGFHPCHIDGSKINGLVNSSHKQNLCDQLVVDYYLSNKPKGGVELSYYDKITRYYTIISKPAEYLNNNLTAKTFKPIHSDNNTGPFKYIDTMSSRYDIQTISNKLKNEKIAIIGLGGTGSYVLDFIAKTPVKEIHLFDGDIFCTHNAYRAPGSPSFETLNKKQFKTEYYESIYSNMRSGIISHSEDLTCDNIDQLLHGFDFVFVCIDNAEARIFTTEFLGYSNIPFIDTGIGLYVTNNEISGQIRTTCCNDDSFDKIKDYIPTTNPEVDNAYRSNIQIAEINALNAALAVIKWKQFKGFYNMQINNNDYVFSINDMTLNKR